MKTRLAIVALIVLVSLLVFLGVCPGIRSWENARFTVKVIGTEGTEFEGFCTHEVKYLIGSRTEATDLQGVMTTDKNTFEFVVPGIEISCVINNKTPSNSITIILLKDGTEVNRVEGAEYHFYLDYYPPLS
jgi:archaellum component FlaF (FlaF/FlaG flagellin family)